MNFQGCPYSLNVPEEGSVGSITVKENSLANSNYLKTSAENSSDSDTWKLPCDKECNIM